jgi:hypothetical protein
MRALLGLCLVVLLARSAAAEQITFPLVVDYPLLRAALARQLAAGPDGTAVIWGTAGGCRYLTLGDLGVGRSETRLRLTGLGKARVGFQLLGFCLSPLSWDGHLETLATPEIDPAWRLRLRDLDSHVYDREWRRTVVASRLWDVVKGHVEDAFSGFTFDLAPPLDYARALVRASVDPGRAAPILDALSTLRPAGVEVTDDGVRIQAAIDVPPTAPRPTAEPEPALAPIDVEKWQARLESWDGFLVFVIKDLGAAGSDERIRDQLLALLLDSRHLLLDALAGGPQSGVDPVRQLFLDAWERLRIVVREAEARGALDERALRWVAFLAAGDVLAALDAAGPSFGLEISADGLRRLARILEPDYAGDPVAYSEAPDDALRELFHFHDPARTLPPSPPPPDGSWWIRGPRAADAAEGDPMIELSRRLDRWVPATDQLREYRDAVGRLLGLVSERTVSTDGIASPFDDLYRHLVPTTAWQESCWRQFVQKDGRVTFLLSSSGDIGLMQVNRRVWRGFFDLSRLEWDIAYNAGAGAEILSQLLVRYGVREAAERSENAARATYAAYNGGPEAFRRYRQARVPRAQRAVDRAFWEKYQAMAAGRALDFVLCVESWGSPGAWLSRVPVASTPKCCTSSRSSSATSTSPRRQASISSRPRASFV